MTEPEAGNGAQSGKKVFTPSFKLKAVMLVMSGGETKAKVSRMENVPESTLRGWCKNHLKIAKQVYPNINPADIFKFKINPQDWANISAEELFKSSPQELFKISAQERLKASPEELFKIRPKELFSNNQQEQFKAASRKRGEMPSESPAAKRQKPNGDVLDLSYKSGNTLENHNTNDSKYGAENNDNMAELRRLSINFGLNQPEVPAFPLSSVPPAHQMNPSDYQNVLLAMQQRLLSMYQSPLNQLPFVPVSLHGFNSNSFFPAGNQQPLPGSCSSSPDLSAGFPANILPRNRQVLSEVQPSYSAMPNLWQLQDQKLMMAAHHARKLNGTRRPALKKVQTPRATPTWEPTSEQPEVQEPTSVPEAEDLNISSASTPIFKHYKRARNMSETQQPNLITIQAVPEPSQANEAKYVAKPSSSSKISVDSLANKLCPENQNRSLEESLRMVYEEGFCPAQSLQHGEKFLQSLTSCSHPSITRNDLHQLKAMVEVIRNMSRDL